MLSSLKLKEIVTAARPIIERQIDDAEQIAAFRDVVSSEGGDWSALKALIKAQVQDERDDAGDGRRVRKILDKAGFATAYADMLGLANMNEDNFSGAQGRGRDARRRQRFSESMDDAKALSEEAVELGLIDPERHAETARLADALAAKFGAGPLPPHSHETGEIIEPLPPADPAAQGAGDHLFAVGSSSGRTEPSADGQPIRAGSHIAADHDDAGPDAADDSGSEPGSVASASGGNSAAKASRFVDDKPLRPYCLHPGPSCGGYGRNHCGACQRAASNATVPA